MGFLDAYDTFVNNKCNALTQQNSTFEKLTESLGLSNLVGGIEDFISSGIVESLKNSPLRDLAEDVLAQTITDNARRLSQNLMNQIPDKLTNTLTDIRSTAFNAVFTTLTFKNDMVLYFASVVAQECVDAIRDKRLTLLALQESVRKLHNALLVLAGGGPFFNQYLEDLRSALLRLDDADFQLSLVQSAFFSQTRFPRSNFNRAKDLLSEAYDLMLPPVTGEDAEELNEGFLKGVFQGPEYGRQLAMLQSIPKLAKEVLGNYDLYAVKVIKVNALLLGFQSTVQNLKEVTGGQFKDTILSHLQDSRTSLQTIIKNMALQLNGNEAAIQDPIPTNRGQFRPNPTQTSARAIEWSVRVKAVELMLETIDADALQTLSISNNALRQYNQALEDLGELDDRVTQLAILRATDGREQPGDIESDLVTLAFQANQAIVDSALTQRDQGRFDSRSVLALGAKVNARLQLSIDQDREVENILLRYIKSTESILDSVSALGDSVFGLLDSLGMDRASDFLRRGAFGEFFSMSGRTSTYVGAAVAALSGLQQFLNTQEQRDCIVRSVNKIKVEETSKRLATQRAVNFNYVRQQKQNQEECEELQQDREKTESCTVGLDIGSLRDNPIQGLQGVFRGIFGGDIADSLSGAGGGFSRLAGGDIGLGGVISGTGIGEGITTIQNSASLAKKAVADAQKVAEEETQAAKDALSSALSESGIEASVDEELSELQEKANIISGNGENETLNSAIVQGKIADERLKEVSDLSKNNKGNTAFTKFG